MNKFSNLKKQIAIEDTTNKALFSNKGLKVIEYENWNVVVENDTVVVIPYLIETNQIIIRQEYIPTYKYADGQEMHITLVGGTIEKDETPEEAMLRELQEEAGIVIRPNYVIEKEKPLFKYKGSSSKYYMYILNLAQSDFHEINVDKSKEHKLDKAIKMDIKYIHSLNVSDTITELMLEKLKRFIHI